MATKKNIAIVIATIRSIYPYYAKESNMDALCKTWLLILQDYEDRLINNALLLCLKECEMPPTPAQIIKKIEELQPTISIAELWDIYVKTLYEVEDLQSMFRYTYTESNGKSQGENAKDKVRKIFNNLPDELKAYIGSVGELVRLSRKTDDTTLLYAKNQFLKHLPTIREEQKLLNSKEYKAVERLKLNDTNRTV